MRSFLADFCDLRDDSAAARAEPAGARADAAFANRRDVLTAQVPSMGTMSARAAARLYAALLGHIDAARLLPADRLAEVATVAFIGHDEVMDIPPSCALGYSVDRPGARTSRLGSTFDDGCERVRCLRRHRHRGRRGRDAQPVQP